MAMLKDYKSYFKPDDVPDALVKLVEFEDGQHDSFSQGFEMDGSNLSGQYMFKSYSSDPEFLNSFREFAQADGTGSIYAIRRRTGTWGDAPIVAFGSEGGAHVVAKNLLELLRILTLDAEPLISWERVGYCKDPDAESSARAAKYAKWLAKNFKLKPVAGSDEVEQIVKNAQDAFESAFQEWMKQYVKS